MNKLLTSAILCLSIAVFASPKPLFAYDDGDWQHWNRESVEGNITKDLKATIDIEFRFGDNCSELYHQYSELGLSYRLCGWFDLGLNYRQIYEKKGDTWGEENRPHLNATFTFRWLGLEFQDRNRLEYRVREGKDDVARYRNRLRLRFPVKWTHLKIQPYVADEIFIDFDQGELNRNRLYLGAAGNLVKPLKLDLYYLWQSSESSGTWLDCHIIGSKLKAAF